jgi:deoxyribose-phosphate aldolase
MCKHEIAKYKEICTSNNVLLKVTIEAGLLTNEQVELAVNLCILSGVDFISDSTQNLKNL